MEKKQPTNLFSNPMVDAAMKSLTPEQREEYERIGKYMYSTTNYAEQDPKPKSVEEDMVNGIFYVREALKSGLHPQDMDEKELRLMQEVYGNEWYKEYGYTQDEVPSVEKSEEQITIPLTKKQLKNLEKKVKRKEWKKNNPGKPYKKGVTSLNK